MTKVYIGQKIKNVVESSGLSAAEFAKKINRSRDVAYKIFNKENMDTGLLRKISTVLEHDFFSYYSDDLPIVKEPGKIGYTKKTDLITSLGEEIKAFKKKFTEMEEKYETLQKLSKFQEEKISRLEKKEKK
jgi:transcriptional regulator with XRE-family HTH domain